MSNQQQSVDGINTIDTDRLQTYFDQQTNLAEPLGQIVEIEKFSGGQSNPTFLLTMDNPSRQLVLRKQPPGELLKSAHAVDREYRVMAALQGTAVAVPDMMCLCEDKSVIGTLFFIMNYVPGVTFWQAALPEVDQRRRAEIYRTMGDTLAELALIKPESVGLGNFGRPGNYFERQLSRWSGQYRQTEMRSIASMEWIMGWLTEHMPADDGRVALVHGDFRLDNLKFVDEEGGYRVAGVLDWELSTLGHPPADLSNLCMQLRVPEGMANMSGLAGKDVLALGIPDEQTIVTRFEEATSVRIEHWPFYVAFGLFRIAAILQGVAKRAVEGNASNPQAAKLAEFVEPLADIAIDVAKNG